MSRDHAHWIHFNTEGFNAPASSRARQLTIDGDPSQGFTNWEFAHAQAFYDYKTYFWRGDAPDYEANLQPVDYLW